MVKKSYWPYWIGLTLFCVMTMTTANIQGNQNIIIFGDSLSDMGNNTWIVGKGYHGAPITNQPTAAAKVLWPNLIVSQIHGTPLSPHDPFLFSQSASPHDPLQDDVNFAYASAETGANYLNDLDFSRGYPPYVHCAKPGLVDATHSCVPGLIAQVQLYLTQVQQQPNPNTVFILWAGGNDFFNNVSKLLAHQTTLSHLKLGLQQLASAYGTHQWPHTGGVVYSHPVQNIRQAVTLLVQHDVPLANIYVLNLPDMSKVPAARDMVQAFADSFVKAHPHFAALKSTIENLLSGAIRFMSASYNTALRLALCFNQTEPNLAQHHLFKINAMFKQIETNKALDKKYGLTNITDSCVDKGDAPECKGYAFYEIKHPTLAVEHVLADQFVGAETT